MAVSYFYLRCLSRTKKRAQLWPVTFSSLYLCKGSNVSGRQYRDTLKLPISICHRPTRQQRKLTAAVKAAAARDVALSQCAVAACSAAAPEPKTPTVSTCKFQTPAQPPQARPPLSFTAAQLFPSMAMLELQGGSGANRACSGSIAIVRLSGEASRPDILLAAGQLRGRAVCGGCSCRHHRQPRGRQLRLQLRNSSPQGGHLCWCALSRRPHSIARCRANNW